MDQQEVNQFLSQQAILTFGGASLAVTVVANTIRVLTKRNSPWIGFLVSLLVVFGGALARGELHSAGSLLLALVNSCLLFCTAAGITDFARGAVETRERPGIAPQGAKPVKWLSPWFDR